VPTLPLFDEARRDFSAFKFSRSSFSDLSSAISAVGSKEFPRSHFKDFSASGILFFEMRYAGVSGIRKIDKPKNISETKQIMFSQKASTKAPTT
jgi:hypothetical protein